MAGERILIVDDDPALRETLSEVLSDEGYQVTVASDGEQALEELDRAPPDLVILDVMLPRLDAYGFHRARLEASRSEGNGIAAPKVLVLSAVPNVAEVAERVHATAWLPKPFRLSELLDRIEEMLAG